MSLEAGISLFIPLVVARECSLYSKKSAQLTEYQDLDLSPSPESNQCHVLAPNICDFILRDPFSVVLTAWAALQLTWVTMLLFVQGVQISRATTTYESMRGNFEHGSRASEAITTALTAGSTSMDDAQLPGTTTSNPHGHKNSHKGGSFAQWKKLLGLDTFVATAQSGIDGRGAGNGRNPFSRGIYTNCKDFWLDPAPLFGPREVGIAMLDGQVVNYAEMYESPPRMRVHRAQGPGAYQSISTDDVV